MNSYLGEDNNERGFRPNGGLNDINNLQEKKYDLKLPPNFQFAPRNVFDKNTGNTANQTINNTLQNYFLNQTLEKYINNQNEAVKKQYEREIESAKIASSTSANEARRAREWSEHMSNTSYQRAVKDLIAAGLNPALAYSHGGASTPNAAVGTSYKANSTAANYNYGGYFNVLTSAVSSASQLKSTRIKALTDIFKSLLYFLG